jgi:hypothetical protein
MAKQAYTIALRVPAEYMLYPGPTARAPVALASMRQLQVLEQEVLATMQAISRIDQAVAVEVQETLRTAELLKLLYGTSPAFEAYDAARRQEYLQTMHDVVTAAHARLLARLQRR